MRVPHSEGAACSDEVISSVQPAIARIGAADASPQLILSAGRGTSPPLRRIRRSNAVKSARFRRSAKKAAVFMAASFSETAVATNWLMLIPFALARRSTSAFTERGRRSG